jgi:flagellar hook-associated protein 2
MAGTISMAGLGSGMDVSGIVDALVNAEGIQKIQLQNRLSLTSAASTSISDISSLLAKLKTASDALSTPERAQGYSVTSSSNAISASLTTTSSAARYSVNVEALSQEFRSYSNTFGSLSAAVGASDGSTMSISLGPAGAATTTDISLNATDTLSTVVDKINSANIGVTASTLFDGSTYRLQLRSKESGAANEVHVSGFDMGLELNPADPLEQGQQAQNAHITVDGIDIYSSSNVVSGAIPGVTLTLSTETTSPVDVNIKSDSTALGTKIQTFIDAYNSVVKKIHTVAGYGSTDASVEMLAGNSTLRSLTSRMSSTLRSVVDSGNASYTTLGSIGIATSQDGTLTLDNTKLSKAVSASPDAVARLFAGSTSTDGVMDLMSSLATTFNNGKDGLLTNQLNTIKSNITRLNARIDREDDRLTMYRERLEKQFNNMDNLISASNATLTYLQQYMS